MFGSPEITQTTIRCEECGKLQKKITSAHLKLHNLTIPEYKEKWGFCKTQPLEAFYIKELRQEYNADYKSWENIRNNPNSVPFKKGERIYHKVSEQERLRLASISINVQHTEEFRKKISKSSKIKWKDPVYRDKFKSNERHQTKEFKERMSKQAKTFWLEDKEGVEKIKEKRKLIWSTPEKRKYASDKFKNYWNNRKNIN